MTIRDPEQRWYNTFKYYKFTDKQLREERERQESKLSQVNFIKINPIQYTFLKQIFIALADITEEQKRRG